MGIAADIVIIMVASLVGAIIVRWLGQPPLVGYILAGFILGPPILGIITDVEEIELLAEIGVSLLMFSLGLQLRLKDLEPVRRIALFGTPLQMIITIGFGVGCAYLFGWDILEGVWFGSLLALSSTVVVLKLLQERNLLSTLSSRVIIGVMIVQDLAVIPLLLLLPQLNDLRGGLPEVGWALLRAAGFILVMVFAGTRLIPRLLGYVAGWQSRELFLICVTAIGLGVGYLTYSFGLSFAFGAFAAGLVLSESDYSHQALGDIIPLRDIFSLLFFASIGMLLDPQFIWNNIGLVLLVVVFGSIGKGLILGVMARLFGYANITPLAIGLMMFQIGEFSFVLAGVGLASGSITPEFYSLMLGAAVLSIILTPTISGLIDPLYNIQRKIFGDKTVQTIINFPQEGLNNHVIIAGGGHIGRYVAQVLQQMGLSFVVLELNPESVTDLKARGIPVIYGDASHPMVLEAAQFRNASLLVDTVPSILVSQAILDYVRQARPDLHVVARVESEEELRLLNQLGVYEGVMPQFEAGLELVRQSLLHLEIEGAAIRRYINDCRASLYAPLRESATINFSVPVVDIDAAEPEPEI